MTDPRLPPNFAREWQDVKDRLSKVERLERIPFSSSKGGKFQVLDPDGNVLLEWGQLDISASINFGDTGTFGGYGVVARDENGAIISAEFAGTRGRVYPQTPYPMHSAAGQLITGTSFAAIFEADDQHPVGDVLQIFGGVQTDASTTGQLRLSTSDGNHTTSTLAIPASTNGSYLFQWLHPAAVGLADPRSGRERFLQVSLDARVASGSGTFRLFPPSVSEITSSWIVPDATTTGNPVLS